MIMEKIDAGEEVGGAGGANSYSALKRMDQIWSSICDEQSDSKVPEVVTRVQGPLVNYDYGAGSEIFDVLVCGGTLGIFVATALSSKGLRVVITERNKLKGREQEWNISRKELMDIVEIGILSEAEIEQIISSDFNPDVSLEDLDIRRVIYGIFPTFRDSPLPAAFDRVLQVGDASGIQSPVSFLGFGSLMRHLGRLSNGIHEAVEGDFLDFHSLRLLNPYMVSVLHSDLCIIQAEPRQLFLLQPNLSASWLFHRAMSVRPQISVSPTFVNELLFANFQSMQKLGDSVLRSFLQDVIQFGPLVKTLGLVMLNRPQVLPSIFKQVGLGVILDWSGHFLMLGYYTFLCTFIDPAVKSWVESLPPRDKFKWKRYLEAWRYGAGLDYRQGE